MDIKLKRARTQDYLEIATMFIEFLKESYPDRQVFDINSYKLVTSWFESNADILISTKDSTITGFSLSYIDTNGGTLNAVYRCEIVYVKPLYRYTKSAYKLMIEPIKIAKANNIDLVSKGTMYNNVHKIHAKLGATPLFTESIIKYS